MKILIDINHPAHVHLFRNAIKLWQKRGHEILVTAREKEITTQLLKLYNIDYILTAKSHKRGILSFLFGVIELDWTVFWAAKSFNPDVMVGTSMAIAHVSKLLPAISIVFGEDDKQASRLFWRFTQPFADFIVTPNTISDDFGEKQITYAGNQELAYLHPDWFQPDASVLDELGISPEERIFLLRFVSLQASHDIGEKGLSFNAKKRLIEMLSHHGRVLITAEGILPDEFKPYQIKISPHKMHDVIAFADLLVADSQSMTIEAALLGTPALRCNTFVGRTPIIEDLEQRYGLTYGFLPTEEALLFEKVEEIVSDSEVKAAWQRRKAEFLADTIDVTTWMVELVEKLGARNEA